MGRQSVSSIVVSSEERVKKEVEGRSCERKKERERGCLKGRPRLKASETMSVQVDERMEWK